MTRLKPYEYTATFPAGEYYIGDLCYVMHAEWKEVCDLMFANNDDSLIEGELTLADGRKIFIASTAHGDGTYQDNGSGVYSVDSGTIGVIAVKDISADDFKNINDGTVYTFETEFNITAEYGSFNIGNVIIETDYLGYEEDDYEEDEDEEDFC